VLLLIKLFTARIGCVLAVKFQTQCWFECNCECDVLVAADQPCLQAEKVVCWGFGAWDCKCHVVLVLGCWCMGLPVACWTSWTEV
jgi:hypothetical protein